MITANGGKLAATLGLLAFAAGSAAAADGEQSRILTIEVVEVVEKSRPAPVNEDDYFRPLAAELSAAMTAAVKNRVATAATVGYQLLSAELEMNQGSRVAADDTQGEDHPNSDFASL